MDQNYFKSSTGAELNLYSASPAGSIRGVIQITHGMVEHAGRYNRFAEKCLENGFAVFAHDLRGHGKSKAEDAPLGCFGISNGLSLVLEDQNCVIEFAKQKFPGAPIICFGHSLGAIIALNYTFMHPTKVSGLACWNRPESKLLAKLSQGILHTEKLFRGSVHPSLVAWKLSYGAWNSQFKPNRTVADWISQDNAEVDKYVADPLCGFDVSISMWLDVLKGAFKSGNINYLTRLPKSLPIHTLCGSDDPCTNYGKDSRSFEKKLLKAGIKDFSCEILDDTRHESLNEWNREQTTERFFTWLRKRF